MKERDLGQILVTILAFVVIGIGTGCADDENDGGIVGGDPPEMVTDVGSIVFLEVSLGETDVQTLTVMNTGIGELRVDSVKLVEETTTDSGREFAKGDDWVNAFALQTDEALRFSVEYTPGDKQADEGYIELATNDPKYPDGIARIPLETPAVTPRIFSKKNVIFRRVPPVNDSTRDKFWQITEVQNIGQAPLTLSDLIVTPSDSEFSVSFPESLDLDADPANDGSDHPTSIAPGESIPVRVYFNPEDDLPATAEMLLYSNDPTTSEYEVNLLGNSGSPCIKLSDEEEINFGEGAIGFANNKTVIVENCSPVSELALSQISVCTFEGGANSDCDSDDETFTIKDGSLPGGLPDEDAVLAPRETSSFVLTYTPEDVAVKRGELVVGSDDPAKSPLVVPIVGKGTDNECPEAIAEASIAGANRWQNEVNTIPLKTVHFRGSNSSDRDGTIDRFEWDVVQRPTGSTARMVPNNQIAEPTMFLDLAGEYVVELRAFDDRGTESCGEQAIVTINATPDEEIHVQLVWDTPADSDQEDTDGTDVDLHFMHPDGEWNSAPYDIYWLNTTADWGVPGDESDDPSLDIDDTDGAGPENVNLDNPENGLSYEVGVFYFASNGFGPTYATVRIFVHGAQQYEEEMLLEADKEFWHVGTISWPNAQITPTNTTQLYFP